MEGYPIRRSRSLDYPDHIALQKVRYGFGNQRYDEKRDILHNWYSDLRAYLPVIYHMYDMPERMYKAKKDEYNKTLSPLLQDVSIEIGIARLQYKSTFENRELYDPDEAAFCTLLDGIKERLDVITAITKVLQKAKGFDDDEGEVVSG
jgi:hypothetical protein